ncbi:J domain-containing protein [Eggerthellaceae bacterium zg-1084]|uniref:J domain-containing protein n=1 Tax=Berryella wangjianweii TaxID=2734634 RepID=A0A6M8J4N2_9ACTN|nr:J domain-containing protein [Berryella wangjianweii]NPD30947.1 J domain-containing protein [Berryella wangjianweii]NPD31812.1 J domain-containing protein [Eggerthellaceae bacterium zg-997]QKF07593.1 J domain-containing protein [Berryella wangjianweii]
MNRSDALKMFGLGDDATPSDVKSAYRELAQIMHPDRFAGNNRLQERATEQFKRLQEAYEVLKDAPGPSAQAAGGRTSRSAAAAARTGDADPRIAGIRAARIQLVEQREVAFDQRRNALGFIVVGVLAAFFLRRFAVAAALGSTAALWGIVQLVSTQRLITTLGEHLDRLKVEERRVRDEASS